MIERIGGDRQARWTKLGDNADAWWAAVGPVLGQYYRLDWTAYGPPQWDSIEGWVMGLDAELAALPPAEAATRIQTDERLRTHCFERVVGTHTVWFGDRGPFWARLGRWLARRAAQRGGRPLRVWSAGCGTGEEPYALALLLLQRDLPGAVRATSIDAVALRAARVGTYPGAEQPRGWPFAAGSVARYFTPHARSSAAPAVRVGAALRRRVSFREEDLLGLSARATATYDLIVCRGVLGYLRHDLAAGVVAALAARLRIGGRLWATWAYWPAICPNPPAGVDWPALRALPAAVPLRPSRTAGCWVRVPRRSLSRLPGRSRAGAGHG
jgi:chemotaxis methyl-accepting protein methylase